MDWKPKKPALMLRACHQENGKLLAYRRFRWKRKGLVVAPDWSPAKYCGNGLHGLLWGQGNLNLLEGSVFMAVEIDEARAIDLNGKIKVPAGFVLKTGKLKDVCSFIASRAPAGFLVPYTSIDRSSRSHSVAAVGHFGTAVTGLSGCSFAGRGGLAKAGDYGHAVAGDKGTSVTGADGTSVSGYGGIAIAGRSGKSFAGTHGVSVAGDSGRAVVGPGGRAKAGSGGRIEVSTFGNGVLVEITGVPGGLIENMFYEADDGESKLVLSPNQEVRGE